MKVALTETFSVTFQQNFFNPNLYGGGANLPPGSFSTAHKRLALDSETLWLLLLAYYTSFGIPFGHQGPKLLPW